MKELLFGIMIGMAIILCLSTSGINYYPRFTIFNIDKYEIIVNDTLKNEAAYYRWEGMNGYVYHGSINLIEKVWIKR